MASWFRSSASDAGFPRAVCPCMLGRMEHGLIFDLDGTLVDSLPGIEASLNRTMQVFKLPAHPPQAVRRFIGNGARMLVTRAAPGADEALIDALEEAFKADYDLTWVDGTRPYAGISNVLGELQSRGHHLAVLSNKPHPFTVAIVARLFPSVRFSAVVGQRPGIPHKPDPAGALEISRLIDVDPGFCTVIGDSTMDLETARHAGMRSVAVGWGYHDRDRLIEARPDAFVDEVEELLMLPGSAHRSAG